MSRPLIVIDAHFLCHRSFHVMGGLQNGIEKTGVLFGVLREVLTLVERFRSKKLVFCFDVGRSKRGDSYPLYKSNRKKGSFTTEKELESIKDLQNQIFDLRNGQLQEFGFTNVLFKQGYEADDIMGSICKKSLDVGDDAILVSADKDMYQLLRSNVEIYNPMTRKVFNVRDFKVKYGISPREWIMVKAIGGCSSDCIRGIKGVREATAVKYIAGKLPDHHKTYKRIVEDLKDIKESIYIRNLELVTLPFKGTGKFEITKNLTTHKLWKAACRKYGIRSLQNEFPETGGM